MGIATAVAIVVLIALVGLGFFTAQSGGWARHPRAPGWGFRLEPGWRHQLWVLDVDGLRFVVNAGIALDASARAESELLQIVKSIDIEP